MWVRMIPYPLWLVLKVKVNKVHVCTGGREAHLILWRRQGPGSCSRPTLKLLRRRDIIPASQEPRLLAHAIVTGKSKSLMAPKI